jgi:energy-coupling factor transporter ATP-binding protein EcfA2
MQVASLVTWDNAERVVQVGSFLSQIFASVQQYQDGIRTKDVMLQYLFYKIITISPIIERSLQAQSDQNVEKYRNLKAVLERASSYIETCLRNSESYMTKLSNYVKAHKHTDEIIAIDKEIDTALRQAVGELPFTMDQVLHQLRGSETDDSASNILDIIANFRSCLQIQIETNDPINSNIHRDIILNGTTRGQNLLPSERLRFEKCLEESKSNDLMEMFTYDVDVGARTECEIREFYEQYMNEDDDINLETVVKQAIRWKHNSTLDKFYYTMASDPDFYRGKMFLVNSSQFPSNLEIKKPALLNKVFDGYSLDFELAGTDDDNCRLYKAVQNQRTPNKVVLHRQETSICAFGQFLKSLFTDDEKYAVFSSTSKTFIMSRRTEATFFKDESFVINTSESNARNYELSVKKESVFLGFRGKDRIVVELFDPMSNGKLAGMKYIIYYEDNNLFVRTIKITAAADEIKGPKNSTTFSQLDRYLMRFEDIKFDSIELEMKDIHIKQKILTTTEIRYQTIQKMQQCKVKFISFLSEKSNQLYIDQVLNFVIQKDFDYKNFLEDFMSRWKAGLPFILANLVEEITSLFDSLSDNKHENHFCIILDYIFEANYQRFIKGRSDSDKAMEIMDRMMVSLDYLESLKNQDLLLFVGATGAGKSTTINYFIGHSLINDKKNGIVKLSQVDCKEDYAPIGTYRSFSETTYARAFRIRETLRKTLNKKLNQLGIDFNVVLCDTPGFDDTRGISFDLTASYSLTHAIKNSNSIKGIVIVIPEKEFARSSKGKGVIDTIKRVEGMLKIKFNELPKEERDCIHIIISHCDDSSKTTGLLPSVINEFYSDCCQVVTDQNIDNLNKDIWKFVKELSDHDHILAISVGDFENRRSFLQKYLSSQATGISKKYFRSVLDSNKLYEQFASFLSTSLNIWENLLLKKFYDLQERLSTLHLSEEVLHEKIQTEEKNKVSIESTIEETEKLKEDLRLETEKIRTLSLKKEEEEEENNEEDYDEEEKEFIEKLEEQRTKRNYHEITLKTNQLNINRGLLISLDEGIINAEEEITRLKEKEISLDKRIREINNEIILLKAGITTITLAKLDPFKIGDQIRVNILKNDSMKNAIRELRQLKPEDISRTGFIRAGEEYEKLSYYVYLEKDYRIVPQEQYLEDFYQLKEVTVNQDYQYIAIFDGHNASIVNNKDIAPNASENGQIVVYVIEIELKKDKSSWVYLWGREEWISPSFTLTHRLSNAVQNHDQIENLITELSTKTDNYKEVIQKKTSKIEEKIEKEEKLKNIQFEIPILENTIKKLKDNFAQSLHEIILENELSIKQKENEIILLQKKLSDSILLLVETYSNELQKSKNEIDYYQLQLLYLSVLIVKDYKIPECWKDFSVQAIDTDIELKECIKTLEYQRNSNSLSQQCYSFLEFYNTHFNTILMKARAVIQEAKSSSILTQTRDYSLEFSIDLILKPEVSKIVNANLNQVNHHSNILKAFQLNWDKIIAVYCDEQYNDEINDSLDLKGGINSRDLDNLKARLLAFGLLINDTGIQSGSGNYFFDIFTNEYNSYLASKSVSATTSKMIIHSNDTKVDDDENARSDPPSLKKTRKNDAKNSLKSKGKPSQSTELAKTSIENSNNTSSATVIDVINVFIQLLHKHFLENKEKLTTISSKLLFFCNSILNKTTIQELIIQSIASHFHLNIIIISNDLSELPRVYKPEGCDLDQILFFGELKCEAKKPYRYYPLTIKNEVTVKNNLKDRLKKAGILLESRNFQQFFNETIYCT